MTLIRQIIDILSPAERRKFVVLGGVIFFMGLLEVVGVVSILPFIQLVADPELINRYAPVQNAVNWLGLTTHREVLLWAGAAVIFLLLLTNAFSVFKVWLQFRYSWSVAHQVSQRLLHAYLSRPYEYFLRRHTSEFTSYIIGEANLLTSGVILPLIDLVSRLFVALVLFLLLVWVDPLIAGVMFTLLGVAYSLIHLSQRNYLKRIGEQRLQLSIRRYMALAELFSGVKTIQVFGQQPFFANRYEAASREFCDLQPNYNLVTTYPRHLLEVLAFGTIVGITIYLFLTRGDIASVLPQLSLYAVAGYRLLPSLQTAFQALGKYVHNRPLVGRLYDALYGSGTVPLDDKPAGGRPPDVAERNARLREALTGRTTPFPFRHDIRLKDVGFTYQGAERPTLAGLDLTIRRGETVAFVGTTGSGKTTTVDLLVGLLDPSWGRILIDGQPLTPELRPAWRSAIAYVPQDVFLFDDSVARNIALTEVGDEAARQRLEAAARMADIHDFIVSELPQGYATPIGEKGVRLSGGQRQRLGLARAFYYEPSVLVLDEATSALDNVTERGIIDSLDALPTEMTVVLIAHRLSTVRRADRIFVVEHGRVSASGSYDELLTVSAAFRDMATAG